MDGGIRRGSDVVKALALGARAVMIGRAYLWGLAANGQAGVENVLDILRGGIDSTLLGLGLSSIDELDAGPAPRSRRASTARSAPASDRSRQLSMTANWLTRPAPRCRRAPWSLVPVGSIEQHGPHLPARHRHRRSPTRSPAGSRDCCARDGLVAPADHLRRQRRAPGRSPAPARSAPTSLRPVARRAGPLAAHLGRARRVRQRATAATSTALHAAVDQLVRRGARRRAGCPARPQDVDAHAGLHRDLADAAPAPVGRCASTGPRPATPRPIWPSSSPA